MMVINQPLNVLQELQATIGEYRKLKEMNWEQETREKVRDDGAQYALNMAYETLKSRYDKMRIQKEETQKCVDEMNSKLVRNNVHAYTSTHMHTHSVCVCVCVCMRIII